MTGSSFDRQSSEVFELKVKKRLVLLWLERSMKKKEKLECVLREQLTNGQEVAARKCKTAVKVGKNAANRLSLSVMLWPPVEHMMLVLVVIF